VLHTVSAPFPLFHSSVFTLIRVPGSPRADECVKNSCASPALQCDTECVETTSRDLIHCRIIKLASVRRPLMPVFGGLMSVSRLHRITTAHCGVWIARHPIGHFEEAQHEQQNVDRRVRHGCAHERNHRGADERYVEQSKPQRGRHADGLPAEGQSERHHRHIGNRVVDERCGDQQLSIERTVRPCECPDG
jgi:hypothetical protein